MLQENLSREEVQLKSQLQKMPDPENYSSRTEFSSESAKWKNGQRSDPSPIRLVPIYFIVTKTTIAVTNCNKTAAMNPTMHQSYHFIPSSYILPLTTTEHTVGPWCCLVHISLGAKIHWGHHVWGAQNQFLCCLLLSQWYQIHSRYKGTNESSGRTSKDTISLQASNWI